MNQIKTDLIRSFCALFEDEARAYSGYAICGDVEANVHRIIVVNGDKCLAVVISFLYKGNLHALDEVLGVPLHWEGVDQVLKVTHGVNMTIEVDVGISETIVLGACRLKWLESALWLDWAGVSGDICRNVT